MKLTPALTEVFHRRFKELLHVVTTVSNFGRFSSRFRIFRDWYRYMKSVKGIKLYVVELALGDQPHQVTSGWNRRHLQLRTHQELWFKESALNAGVERLLPRDWKYLCWIDADVWFHRQDWVEATLEALQHNDVVQPWSECVDLGPKGNAQVMLHGFASMQAPAAADPRVKAMTGLRGLFQQSQQPNESVQGPMGHTGYAWACTKKFWDATGGLVWWSPVGTGDTHIAWGAVGKMALSYPEEASDDFKRRCLEWEKKALGVTSGHIGYVPGLILHPFHGPKSKRKYDQRWEIMTRHDFTPIRDTRSDFSNGLYEVVGKPQFLEEMKAYFANRDEDSTEEFA